MSDSTIQVLEGMLGYGGDEEVSMVNGLDASISLRADPGIGGGLDTIMANKGKILIGLAAAGALFLGYRWWRARRMAASASVGTMDGFPGRRVRRNKRRKARRSRRAA